MSLSAFFFFLALYAYVRYAETAQLGRYLLVAASLLPRPDVEAHAGHVSLRCCCSTSGLCAASAVPEILWEKLPLLALSAVASVVTYFVQRSSGAVAAEPFVHG